MCRFYSEEQQGAGLFTHMGVDETNLGGPLPAPPQSLDSASPPKV